MEQSVEKMAVQPSEKNSCLVLLEEEQGNGKTDSGDPPTPINGHRNRRMLHSSPMDLRFPHRLIAATSLTESILVDELSKTRRGKGRGRMLVLSGVAPLPLMACINGRLTQAHRRVGHPAACLPRSTSSPSASAHGIGARQRDRSIWWSA
jgi:hypothetical protein